ncbi:unnamed protein product [Closterium sp. NIES-53]
MEVTRTSMIHAAAPHFLWPFAVRYAAHQLNLWPRVSLPETSPTLRWTGKVGDASVFRVWGSRAFVRDTSADKLSARAIPCIFLGFVRDVLGWQFYHPTLRRVLPSQDVTFDESIPFYGLFPYRSAPPPPPPLFVTPGPPQVDSLPSQGPAPSGVSQVDPVPSTAPVKIAVVSGAALGATSEGVASGGAASGGEEPGGAGSEGAGSGGAEPEGVEPGGAESEGAESEGSEPRGAALSGGPAGASPRLSSQHMCEWLVPHAHRRSGAPGAGGAGDTRDRGAAVTTGAGGIGDTAATCPGGARTSGDGAAGSGGVGCAGAGDPTEPGAASTGGAGAGVDTVRPRPYSDPLLQQVLGVPSSTRLPPPFLCSPHDQSQPPLQPAFPLPAPSPYTDLSGGLIESRESASRPVLPVCTPRHAPRLRPPPVPGTHTMALCPSSVPLRFPLPAPLESSLPEVPDPASDRARTASPLLLLHEFAAAWSLDYATALVSESESASRPSVGGECALGTDIIEDRQEDFECLLAARHGVDYFQIFSPTPKMTTLWVLLHVTAQRDYELHSLDFSTAFLQCSLHEEIWLRRPPGFSGTFPAGTQWSLRRPVYGLRQAPREWHNTLKTTLAALRFPPSIADPSLFLRTDTLQPLFYVLVYFDDLVFATADTEALTLVNSKLQKRHTCTDLGELRCYLGLQITRDRARRTITLTQSHMVHQVLQLFGFQYSSPQLTLLSTSHSLSATPSDESVELSGPYP